MPVAYKADLRGARRPPSDGCTVQLKLSHSLYALSCATRTWAEAVLHRPGIPETGPTLALKKKVCRIKNKQMCFDPISFSMCS